MNEKCPCVEKNCSRHGNCEACLSYHRQAGSCTSCGKN